MRKRDYINNQGINDINPDLKDAYIKFVNDLSSYIMSLTDDTQVDVSNLDKAVIIASVMNKYFVFKEPNRTQLDTDETYAKKIENAKNKYLKYLPEKDDKKGVLAPLMHTRAQEKTDFLKDMLLASGVQSINHCGLVNIDSNIQTYNNTNKKVFMRSITSTAMINDYGIIYLIDPEIECVYAYATPNTAYAIENPGTNVARHEFLDQLNDPSDRFYDLPITEENIDNIISSANHNIADIISRRNYKAAKLMASRILESIDDEVIKEMMQQYKNDFKYYLNNKKNSIKKVLK